jgi:uncharacterized protein YbjQ (UPF0145 family)
MADCIDCGKKIGFLNRGDFGRCSDCTIAYGEKHGAEENAHRIESARQLDVLIQAVQLTTETAPNLKIIKRIEIVTAEVAEGMHIFKDLFAGVRDIVGGRSEAIQNTMRDARRTVLHELKREAYLVGANAVVGVDLDYVDLSGAGNMVMLVASGTAVVIEDQSQ